MSPADRIDVEPDTYRAESQVFGDTVYPELSTTNKAIDVSKFTPEQIAKVKEFIGPLGPRVFTVGG